MRNCFAKIVVGDRHVRREGAQWIPRAFKHPQSRHFVSTTNSAKTLMVDRQRRWIRFSVPFLFMMSDTVQSLLVVAIKSAMVGTGGLRMDRFPLLSHLRMAGTPTKASEAAMYLYIKMGVRAASLRLSTDSPIRNSWLHPLLWRMSTPRLCWLW